MVEGFKRPWVTSIEIRIRKKSSQGLYEKHKKHKMSFMLQNINNILLFQASLDHLLYVLQRITPAITNYFARMIIIFSSQQHPQNL